MLRSRSQRLPAGWPQQGKVQFIRSDPEIMEPIAGPWRVSLTLPPPRPRWANLAASATSSFPSPRCAPPRSSPGGLGALQVPALLEQHPEIVRRVGDAAFDAASVGGLGALQIPALVLQQQFPLRCQRDSRGLSVDRPSRLSVLGSGVLSTGGRTSASALCDFAGHACYRVGALATRGLALGEHLDERFDDARVELRSGAAA
jgi:hypothetical protein